MAEMEKRHSSPHPGTPHSRPSTQRKRSNSLPLVEALGCSTPEAELILAEGKAAIRSRHASRRRGHRSDDDLEIFRARDHLKYLNRDSSVSGSISEDSLSPFDRTGYRHSRTPSNTTDKSTSTIVAPDQPPVGLHHHAASPVASPLGDYSANLAKFIKSQLNSIPSYKPTHTSISPRSCPDLTFRSPPQSPRKARLFSDAPQSIDIPPVRPPLRSAFSAWSSADDETDDEAPPLPPTEPQRQHSEAHSHTSSVLHYYEKSNSSFLLSSTPVEEEDHPDTAKGFSFPNQSALLGSPVRSRSDNTDDGSLSATTSTRPHLTPSSAPSFSSASTGSYFEYKRPLSFAPQMRDRIVAAVTPPPSHTKIIPAISPFEGGALANIHDVLVESQQRVLVDGMSFDMLRDFSLPDEGMRRVPPC